MNKFELSPVLITDEADWNKTERVFAIIRNDWSKDKWRNPYYGHEYSYSFAAYGAQAPLPRQVRGGFNTAEAAEEASRKEFQQWRDGHVESGTRMERHMAWRTQYRRRRYLQYLSEDELIQRFKDVMCNQTVLTEDLKIGLHPIGQLGEFWMIMFTHILEECVMRKYKYPAPFAYHVSDAQIPKYDWPGLSTAVAQINKLALDPGTFLVKFGKAKYLRRSFEMGVIRIMPASFYTDPSLNQAIKDSELQIHFFGLPSEVKLEVFDGKTGKPKGRMRPNGNLRYTLEARSDYYVYCLSSAFSIRLFGDFEADSCLIIRRPDFMVRVAEEFNRAQAGWECIAGNVDYYDPLNVKGSELGVQFSKHFRFAYQQEFRMVWLPPDPRTLLEPVVLEMGSLEDICEFIDLR